MSESTKKEIEGLLAELAHKIEPNLGGRRLAFRFDPCPSEYAWKVEKSGYIIKLTYFDQVTDPEFRSTFARAAYCMHNMSTGMTRSTKTMGRRPSGL